MGTNEVRYENLVSAAEANAEDYGERREVPGEDSGGHCRGAYIDDHCCDEHLEKLKTDGFCGGGETDTDPVGEENAGTLPVAGFAVVVHFELEHQPEDNRRNEPRERCGEGDSVYAHLGNSKVSFEKHDVQCCVACYGERVADEVPDSKSVGRDEGGEDGLQCAERKSERDNAEELLRVNGGGFGQSHPARN